MSAVRALVGPLIVGAAVWCAMGTLTVADSTSATPRLAAPAAWWIFVLSVGVASAVPGWRHKPLSALPAMLTTLPWWPVPMPAVSLLWTGPMAWLPIGCAVAAAEGGRVTGWVRRALLPAASPRTQLRLAAVLTLLACGAALWSAGYRLRGDEPHYLMITQSLLRDGDLRIENNHDAREYTDFYADGRLVPDFTVRGADGEIYSIHAPGVSALVLPAFALLGWRGAQLVLLLLSTMTGAFIWHIGHRATGDAVAAWIAWAALVLSPTFLLHSFAVFPDAPAAFVTAVAVALALALATSPDRVSTPRLVALSVLLSGLPWLHSRLVGLACGLGLVVAWHVWRDPSRAGDARVRRLAAFFIVPAIGAALWFGFFWAFYGAPDPRLPYGGDDAAVPAWIPGAIVGLLFDQQYGMFFHAPVLAALAAGWFRARGSARTVAVQMLTAVVVYLAAVTLFRMWWAGIPSAPARFLVAVSPALALPAALAWHAATRAGRAVVSALLVLSVAISTVVLAVDRGTLAWNQRDAQARLLEWFAPVVNLPRAFPSFFWTGEAAFLLHTVVTIAIAVATWRMVAATGRAHAWSGPAWRLTAALWMPCALMAVAGAGWLVTQSTGLDPARSQLVLAGLAADAAPIFEIGAVRVARADSTPSMTIRTEQLDRWREQVRIQTFRAVPAGVYDVLVSGPGASTETITATIGDSGEPFATFAGSRLAAGRSLALPGGASILHFGSPNPDVDMTNWTFALRPRHFWPGPPATGSARLGDLLLFVDDAIHVEADGFWTAGASTARVGVANAGERLTLTISNGPLANRVTVAAGTETWRFDLAPNEARPLEIVTTAGAARLTIASATGFQPSQFSDTQDRRLLGVRVTTQ